MFDFFDFGDMGESEPTLPEESDCLGDYETELTLPEESGYLSDYTLPEESNYLSGDEMELIDNNPYSPYVESYNSETNAIASYNIDDYPSNFYDLDADTEASYDELGCDPFSFFDAEPSSALDAAASEETCSHSHSDENAEQNHASRIRFGGSGPGSHCNLCDCKEFLWPAGIEKICKNCGHHYDHHL